MTRTATRFLYLARHGEASADETELTDRGRRQAVLLGERLRGTPVSVCHHGPLPRAAQTARLICAQLGDVPRHVSDVAGDYVPYLPQRAELPPECADGMLHRLGQFPAAERESGPGLARQALAQFTGPVAGDEPRHQLVVTHNFLIGWLVRAALDAPEWRWMGLAHANAALTVIRYTPGRPASLVFFNDMGHLPTELRWTGFPLDVHP
ncbi:histidine phosphatase family protein [Streptomyces angustmyceticus]|uniref:histidine phosphatase family protein n=1 Tax=Streptomyces angustmyceticus TaxID=285578 RepID=UPI00344D22DC